MSSSSLRIDRRAVVALVLLFIVSLPAVTPRIYAADEIEYFAFLRSLWFDRDLSFDNEYRHFVDSGVAGPDFAGTFLERQTETGRRINFGTMGCAILWAPFYAVGDRAARALNGLGYSVAVDGYSRPYVAAVCYGSAVYGFLALLLSLVVVRQTGLAVRGSGRSGVMEAAPAIAVWMGTPLLFYMYVAPPFSHAASAFAVAAFVATWLSVRRRWSIAGFATLGALGALMTMIREQDLFFVVGPAADVAWAAWARVRARSQSGANLTPVGALAGALAAAGTFVLVYTPQAVAYLVLNGRLGPSQLVARKMNWAAPHAFQVLADPAHGLLFWTPLAALAIAGLAALLWRPGEPRRLAVCMLLMVAAQVYVAGSVESWTVAGAFGQRRFVALTVLLVAGLGALAALPRRGAPRLALAAAVVLAVWWNLGLTVQFGSGLMNRQRLELARNAYTSFVALPRALPNLAWRYLFDRGSFSERQPASPR